jgi:nucleoid-associated protein YgaU
MDDRGTETFKPYEPDDSGYEAYDDYDYPESRRPNVLWGRVAILGVALLLAFSAGRATGGGGADEEQLKGLRAQLAEAHTENEQLASDLQDARQAAATEETPTPEPTDTEATDPVDEVEGPTYTVERGDTLRLIAQRLCGDPEIADQIEELNGITDATQLSVGETLTLPEGCEV